MSRLRPEPLSLSPQSLSVPANGKKSLSGTASHSPALADSFASDRACARTPPPVSRNSPLRGRRSLAPLPHVPSYPCRHPCTTDSPCARRCIPPARLPLPESSGISLPLPKSIPPQTSRSHSLFSPSSFLCQFYF